MRGRFFTVLFRNDSLRRLFSDECINQESDADEDERDAENLSHVENHVVLECYLRLLDEFYEEAHTETYDEEYADECSAIYLLQIELVHAQEHDSENQVAQCLVNLRRMFRFGFASQIEDEAPRQSGHVAVNLGVHEVSKTDEGSGKCYRNAEVIHEPHEVEVVFPAVMVCVPEHCKEQHDGAAMACKSSFPRHEYFQESLPAAEIVFRLIEDAMSESGAHDGAYQQCIEQ